jgi:hypothetical protein
MSFTRTVPAGVPSVFHSSSPLSGCSATKKRVPPTAVNPDANDDPGPGRMSLTSVVPAVVPSVFHSSYPWAPS